MSIESRFVGITTILLYTMNTSSELIFWLSYVRNMFILQIGFIEFVF